MFLLIRTLTYATLFISLVLIYLPSRVLTWSGIAMPDSYGLPQLTGMLIATLGGILALTCVFTFNFVGRGTPAPFDPPRKLVTSGPYRYVRNPMYIGAVLALSGAALFFTSWMMLLYTLAFLLIVQGFVTAYEEPTLRRLFGEEYEDYCKRTGRWWPRLKA